MEKFDENWSELIRETIRQRIEEEGEPDVSEAMILNERVKRAAPAGWSSLQVIKQRRRRTSL
jgi:hypothetical protein